MSNASAHSIGAALAVGLAHMAYELHRSEGMTAAPLYSAALGSFMGSLPDVIEPALHPNHRQFFHSIAFAAAVSYGTKQLYGWQPIDPWDQFLRYAGMLIGGCYLAHLAMDFCTRKSLPLVGRL